MRVDLHMDLRQETDEAVPDLVGRTALLGVHTSRSPYALPVAGWRRALRQASRSLTLAPVRRMAPS